MGLALIFPGQGSQYVGMGKDFYENFESVRTVFEKANEILDFNLTQIVFNEEKLLNKTIYTQPAILTVSYAIYQVFKSLYPNIKVLYTAGHSLGEYSALLASNALTFEDALQLVRKRAEYMQNAIPEGKGAMAAVIGISPNEVRELCKQVNGIVEAVNLNSPLQTVVAGEAAAVKEFLKIAKAKKIKVIPLKVSVPSHSSLMREAAEKFKGELKKVTFRNAQIPIVQNYDAKAHINAEEIRINLYLQLFNPVRWTDSVKYMVNHGVNTFIELGPKNVLSKLVKQIVPNVQTYNIDKVEDLKKLETINF